MSDVTEKEKRIDVMIDLETCSRRENAAILSVAMALFDIKTFENVGGAFYGVDLTSCFLEGLDFDRDTQEWWMKQDYIAKKALMDVVRRPVREVVSDLYHNIEQLHKEYEEVIMWSNGSDFDFPKLDYLFHRFLKCEPPYKYYNKRDMRTVYKETHTDISGIKRDGCKHNAMDDCLWQIEVLKKSYEENGGLFLKKE